MKRPSKNTRSAHPALPLENIVPITQARREFFILTDNVLTRSARYVITDHGVPKAMLLPVSDSIQCVGGASIAADMPREQDVPPGMRTKYPGRDTRFHSFFVADGWRNDTHSTASMKDIIRSQLVVYLIERYRYPEESIIIGCSVPVSNNHFIEADILAHNSRGQVISLFIVTHASQFESGKDIALDDLFALSKAIYAQGQRTLSLIGYYMHEKRDAASPHERMILIDCRKYPTRRAWESAGNPTLSEIPSYESLLPKI